MKTVESKQCCGEINIGSGKETSINELAEILIEKFNLKNIKPVCTEPRAGDVKRSWANIEKAKHRLKYQPEFSLYEGLDALLKSINC
jgi:nucleoside-diphosphate-sugar epimerase